MSSSTRKQLEAWIGTKSVNGKIIDIGGSQKPVMGRVNVSGETEVFILDLETPHEVDLSPQIVWDMNRPDLENFPRKDLLKSFDYAVCLEVSEYWYDPLTALRNVNQFLKRGGKLFISFHFLYPVHNPAEFDYLRYTRAGALKLLEVAGFEVLEAKGRISETGSILRGFFMEGMKPAKKYPAHNEVGLLVEAIKK